MSSKVKIGVPKETKQGETRVGLTPNAIKNILSKRNDVEFVVQTGAGELSKISDKNYVEVGALIVNDPALAWDVDIVVKVKEPLKKEFNFINSQIIYGYFHWEAPANKDLREYMQKTTASCIPYECIEVNGKYPCLAPMSAVAGRLAVQKGAQLLEGSVLMGGIPGVPKANVMVVGGGVVGSNAAEVAVGMGADVTVLDIDSNRLGELERKLKVKTLISNTTNLIKAIQDADLIIGAVLIPGKAAPKVLTEDILWHFKPGAVIVDVAIDEGGCTEWSRPTSHDKPAIEYGGGVFYCVPNIPALVPKTATEALVNETSRFIEHLIEAQKSSEGFSSKISAVKSYLDILDVSFTVY